MSRLRPLREDEIPEDARIYFQRQQAAFGTVFNSTAFAAYFPEMMIATPGIGRSHRAWQPARPAQAPPQRQGRLHDRLSLLSRPQR